MYYPTNFLPGELQWRRYMQKQSEKEKLDLIKLTGKTMGTWKARKLVKGARGSRTTGKQKGIVPTALRKWMCRHNRSWKHPLYGEIMGSGEFPRKVKKS
jgi:hypothetical protein